MDNAFGWFFVSFAASTTIQRDDLYQCCCDTRSASFEPFVSRYLDPADMVVSGFFARPNSATRTDIEL